MSAIEFTSRPGKTFIVDVRDPQDDYSSLASGISCTEIRPGRYRADVGSLTGIVRIEAVDGAVLATGFADLDNSEDGYSEVTDSKTSLKSILNQINSNNTDIAGEVSASLVGITPAVVRSFDPITKTIGLVRGDSYLQSVGTAIEIPINLPPGVVVSSIESARFKADHKSVPSQIIGAVSIVEIGDQPTARIEFAKTATSDAQFGEYEYDVEITYSSEDITVLRGSLRLFRDHAIS